MNLNFDQIQIMMADNAASKSINKRENADLKQACRDFEGIMTHQLMKVMRKTLPGEDLLGGSFESKMYNSMYDQYLSEKLASEGSTIGIAEILYDQLNKI